MSNDRDYIVYELLNKVFRDNAYASVELNAALKNCDKESKPYITRLFYGVLEKSIYYDYVLSCFATDKKPKKPIAVIIKMGYYMLENMNIPDYAAVNKTVALCKRAGKAGASGFVNSALRNFKKPQLPQEGTSEYLSVKFSYPKWLCDILIKDYGYDFTFGMLSYKRDDRIHIRLNPANITENRFKNAYKELFCDITKTPVGYLLSGKTLSKIKQEDYIVQSAASIAAAKAYVYGLKELNGVLDLCAAPGGKAVLVSTETGARVTACDIHKHRLEMIKRYAFECDARVNALLNDATIFRPEWENKFDLVICDVPCSGIGVVGSKPDILFNRSQEDIKALTKVQGDILSTASRYVKPGGRLCYSTCTVLKSENEGITNAFIKNNAHFKHQKIMSPYNSEAAPEIKLFPHINGTDGFYVAAFTKIKGATVS